MDIPDAETPQVIKLTLIYGVLGLEQQFPGGTLSIPQLRQLVEKGGAQLVVERHLPGLQRQILNLQTNLDAVFDKLVVEVKLYVHQVFDWQSARL